MSEAPETPNRLVHGVELRAELVRALHEQEAVIRHHAFDDIIVRLFVDDEDLHIEFPLPRFIDVLENGLYWDERGNWANANRLRVFASE